MSTVPDPGGRLSVLLTIQTLEGRAGASLYVRDVALELLRQGHRPVVFSTRLGALADGIRALTVPVIGRLEALGETPDVIHGNAPIETVAALLRFPETPAIFVCHAWDNPDAQPPRMPRIVRYVAVDDTCRDHLVCQQGIDERLVLVRFNAVDLDRFPPRPALPARPARALVFSNNASDDNYVPAIRRACEPLGIELEVVGLASDRPTDRPEAMLGRYDLVFAKARCALEALATGAAVIVWNDSPLVVAGYPPRPVCVSYHWLREDGLETVCFEGLRSPLVPALPPRSQYRYVADVIAPDPPGVYCLRVRLVQEQVAWFETPEPDVATDVLVTVI